MTFKNHVESVIRADGIDGAMAKFGCSRQTLWNWRTGKLTPSLAKLEEMGGIVTFPEAHTQVREPESIPGATTAAELEPRCQRDANAQD